MPPSTACTPVGVAFKQYGVTLNFTPIVLAEGRILLRFGAKVPGLGLAVRAVNMDFSYGSAFNVDSPDAYETLILDAMLGDASLFTRADEVEAAWAAGDMDVLAPRSLIQLANHFKGSQVLTRPRPAIRAETSDTTLDLADIKGQESAKRALEIAAAGGHNLLMSGPPGSGKSMLAARLPSILPPLTPRELLEVSMIHSVAGALAGGELTDRRPFRAWSCQHSANQWYASWWWWIRAAA